MYKKKFHSQDISGFTFLVTGGAGFIGSNLVEYLLKFGAGKVIVADNLATGFEANLAAFKNNKAFSFVNCDIRDADACLAVMQNVDFVLHQAALGSVPRSVENPLATNQANVSGFLNVLNAARLANVKRFVYASSSSVYGDSKQLPKTEDILGKPLSPYAVSKLVDELYGAVFARTYNMEIIGLRYFNIFGPRQSPTGAYAAAIPLFIDAIHNNRSPVIFGDGGQSRDFTFVENAVQANIKAVFCDSKNATGNVFNIAYGKRITLNELIVLINGALQKKIEPVYKEERKGDIRDSLADISKATAALGYTPEISIEQGLPFTVEWLQQHQQK